MSRAHSVRLRGEQFTMANGRNEFSSTMRIDIPEDLILDANQESSLTAKLHTLLPAADEPAGRRADRGFETKYEELLQNIYDAALITDLNGTIIDSNIRASQFFNFSKEEFYGLPILKLIANAEESLIRFICDSLADQRYVLVQAFCMRKNQTLFPVEIAVNMLRIPDTQLCFFIRDITARQKAEDALRESELKFRTIFENSTDGISVRQYTFDDSVESRLMDCNKAYVEMSGLSLKDLYAANTLDLIRLITPASREELSACVTRMQPFEGTFSWLRPDGRENIIDYKAVPMQIGNRIYVYSIDRDVTRQKRAEEAIRKAEKQEAMIASVGAACHHLGQPATVLLTNLTLLQSGHVDQESVLSPCLQAAERIADILHKLNAVDEYKTIPYAPSSTGDSAQNRILDI